MNNILCWLDLHADDIKQAAIYYVEYKWTMRQIAENMLIGETTVRRWLNVYLKNVDLDLYYRVRKRKEDVKYNNMFCRDTDGRFRK